MAADGPAIPSATNATEATEISWRLAGPGGGGWIPSLLWDPHDAHTLYVGCDVGGFFVSKAHTP
ncbi:hypothetical protein CfE428DRAFT_0582 [Chthoniobacter flavus Ellin428]|uniref:Uncharacterized protein n=1 Tax=Chthoniobacter flavus Ellin428 TaxID=497964 RepID=B4CV69_9BACT|nr:hypothetical protein [Chthoniobacter flavus]EDY22457.1 hypothetical protein CfE428DRAFT_0582 [Chthoniobacter flavus Ellin428]